MHTHTPLLPLPVPLAAAAQQLKYQVETSESSLGWERCDSTFKILSSQLLFREDYAIPSFTLIPRAGPTFPC